MTAISYLLHYHMDHYCRISPIISSFYIASFSSYRHYHYAMRGRFYACLDSLLVLLYPLCRSGGGKIIIIMTFSLHDINLKLYILRSSTLAAAELYYYYSYYSKLISTIIITTTGPYILPNIR